MREKLITFLKIVISVGLIAYALARANLGTVASQLASAKLWLVIAALALYMLAIVVNGLKWQVLLRAQGIRVPFTAMLQFLFVGFFFNNFLPANVGGDVMRGYGLARYTDRTADAAVSVIVDRVVGLMAYLSTAVIAAVVAVNLTGHTELAQVEWVAIIALLGLMLGFGLLLSRRLRGLISRHVCLALAEPPGAAVGPHLRCLQRLPVSLRRAGPGIRRCAAGDPLHHLRQLVPLAGDGRLMSLEAIFLFNPLIALVLMIPISIGGIGVSQTAYPFFFGLAGVPADHSLAVSLMIYAVAVVASLPGGVLWLKGRRANSRN